MHIQINVYYTFHQLTLSIRNSSSRSEKSSTRSSRSPSLECVKQGDTLTLLCIKLGDSVCLCHHGDVAGCPSSQCRARTSLRWPAATAAWQRTAGGERWTLFFPQLRNKQTKRRSRKQTNMVDLTYTVGGSFERATKIVLCSFSLLSSVCLRKEQTDNGSSLSA